MQDLNHPKANTLGGSHENHDHHLQCRIPVQPVRLSEPGAGPLINPRPEQFRISVFMQSNEQTHHAAADHPPAVCGTRTTAVMLAAFLLMMTAAGCGSFRTVRADGTVVRHYLGYTRVIIPAHASTGGNFSVTEISSTGVRLWPSVGLGYFRERNEYVPLDSRIVIRVKNSAQMDQAIRTLTPIAKDGLCVTMER